MADDDDTYEPAPYADVTSLDLRKKPPKSGSELFAHLTYKTTRNVKSLLVKLEVFKQAPDAPPVRGQKPPAPTAFFPQPLPKAKDDPSPHEYIYQQKVKPGAHTYRFTIYKNHSPKGPQDELHSNIDAENMQAITTGAGGATYQLTFPASEGPRLITAINETTIAKPAPAGATEAETVLAICDYVEKRLLDDDAFAAVWLTPSGTHKQLPTEELARAQLEEEWAQRVSERMCFSVYGGPTVAYGMAERIDHVITKRVLDDADPLYPVSVACQHTATFLAMSRGFDTQFEASGSQTKSIVEQGMKKGWGKNAVEIIPPIAGVAFKVASDAGGPSYPSTQEYLLKKDFLLDMPGTDELFEQKVTPGSCFISGIDHLFAENWIWCPLKTDSPTDDEVRPAYIYHPEGGDTLFKLKNPINVPGKVSYGVTRGTVDGMKLYRIRRGDIGAPVKTSEAHIAAILRVDKTHKRLMAFDTGGGLGNGYYDSPPSLAPMGSTSVHQESAWTDKNKSLHMHGYCGHAILPQPSDDQLTKAVARLRKMRPIGMIQLVVLRRPDPGTYSYGYKFVDVVWASKVLPMHAMSGTTVASCFTTARLIWSLRGHPGLDKLEARWIVWAPRGPLADEVMKSPAGTVAAKVDACRSLFIEKRKNGSTKQIPLDGGRALPYQAAMRMVECGSAADGTAALAARAGRNLSEKLQGNGLHPIAAAKLAWDTETGAKLPPNTTLKLIR